MAKVKLNLDFGEMTDREILVWTATQIGEQNGRIGRLEKIVLGIIVAGGYGVIDGSFLHLIF